jgi:ribonuclease R
VTLSETGADGLVPMRSLGDDFYVHDEARHRLVGRRRGKSFTIGDPVRVRLAEANAVTGSLLFSMVEVEEAHDASTRRETGRTAKRQVQRRPAPRSAGYSKRR